MTNHNTENIVLDGNLVSKLRADIEDVFEVVSVETPRHIPRTTIWPWQRASRSLKEGTSRQVAQGVIFFVGNLLRQDSEAVYNLIAERWQAHNYTPMLRRHKEQIALIAWPDVVSPKPSNPWINLGLAVATIFSVLLTGAMQECQCFPTTLTEWLGGLPMMLALMIILLAHEFGHYFAARYHKVAVTLPYFIPLPVISPVGTLGAFIQLRTPFKTKKELFDIGVAGPLGGLIFAIPLIFWAVSASPINKITRGPLIFTDSIDQPTRLWDTYSEREVYHLEGHKGQVNSATLSSDRQTIVTASSDQTVRLWDASTGQEILCLEGHTGEVNSAIFSPDEQTIVTASSDQTVRLWDASTGQEILRLEGHTGEVNSAIFSPDEQTIVTASSDQTARLWDASTGQEILRLEGHTGKVNSAVFSPDGLLNIIAAISDSDRQTIVTASSDQTVRLWDASTGQEILRLEGHTGEVNSAVFSPDEQTIVTASSDQTVRLWNASTGQEILRLEGHTGEVNSAVFSPDGQTILTASSDQTVRLWDVSGGREIHRFVIGADNPNTIANQNWGSVLEGNSIFYLIVKYISFGQLLPSFDEYSNSPFAQEFLLLLVGIIPDGGGTDIWINSVAFAAWFGLFVTAMNLLPVGQLDGGHVIYCLLGEKARWLGLTLVGAMVLAGFFWWPGWLIWAILVYFIIGPGHPPPLNDLVNLGPGRKTLAYLMIIIFVVLFMPNPLQPL
jgi:WD40 repeat protein